MVRGELRRVLQVLVVVGLALGAATAWNQPPAAGREVAVGEVIPLEFSGWAGEAMDIPERVYEILETRDVLLRQYRQDNGIPVLVSVVGGLNNRNAFHPPELCYVGGAYRILEKGTARLAPAAEGQDVRQVARMVVTQGDRRLLVFYFFVAGDRCTESYLTQQVWLMQGELLNRRGAGYLVRMETPIVDGNGLGEAEQRLTGFFWEFLPHQARLSAAPG